MDTLFENIEGSDEDISKLRTFVVQEEFDSEGTRQDTQAPETSNILKMIQSQSLAVSVQDHIYQHKSMFGSSLKIYSMVYNDSIPKISAKQCIWCGFHIFLLAIF